LTLKPGYTLPIIPTLQKLPHHLLYALQAGTEVVSSAMHKIIEIIHTIANETSE
jgi:hypothetical protein